MIAKVKTTVAVGLVWAGIGYVFAFAGSVVVATLWVVASSLT